MSHRSPLGGGGCQPAFCPQLCPSSYTWREHWENIPRACTVQGALASSQVGALALRSVSRVDSGGWRAWGEQSSAWGAPSLPRSPQTSPRGLYRIVYGRYNKLPHTQWFNVFGLVFLRQRDRECAWGWGRERRGGTQNPKQAPGSGL